MSLFKNKKKHDYPIAVPVLENRIKNAIKNREPNFYFPLLEKDLNFIKTYFYNNYHATIVVDHQTDTMVFYKISDYLD